MLPPVAATAAPLAQPPTGGGVGARVEPGADGAEGAEGASETLVLPLGITLAEVELRFARAVLERYGGNQSAAARALDISRNKLARLLRGDSE